jgi:hypothetical protein
MTRYALSGNISHRRIRSSNHYRQHQRDGEYDRVVEQSFPEEFMDDLSRSFVPDRRGGAEECEDDDYSVIEERKPC